MEDPSVLKELTDHADGYSRHFEHNNNTIKSVYTAIPVNYYDETSDTWKTIDNTLTETAVSYEASNGICRTEVSKPEAGKKIKMTLGDCSLSWQYLGREDKDNAEAVSYIKQGFEANNASGEESTVLKVDSGIEENLQSKESRVIYENADANVDLEYLMQGNNLKENIIVKNPAESYRLAFSMTLNGLKMRLSEDNDRIELYSEVTDNTDQTTKKVEAFIPAPFMTDANGEVSEDVGFEVEDSAEDGFRFVVIADSDWMNAPERAFPVVIDPQIVTEDSSLISKQVQTRTIYCGTPSGWSNKSSSYIEVSKTSTLETKTIVTIQKSKMLLWDYPISAVTLSMRYRSGSTTGYVFVGDNSFEITDTTRIDLTNEFKLANNANFNCELYTNSYIVTSFYFPTLEIEYLVESQPVKQQFALVGGMTGEFNVETREWTGSFTDVSGSDSMLGMEIAHVFKKSSENRHVGKDFRLNLNETLVKHGSGTNTSYIYTDSFGNKHGFKENFYYLDESNVRHEITNKSSITVSLDGSLSYTANQKTYEVHADYRTTSGLTAVMKIEALRMPT